MTAFLVGVLLSSLLGSLHCVGMCGPLAAVVGSRGSLWRAHALYQAGRLVTLLVLGLAAGALGTGLDALGGLTGTQRAVAVLAGALMIGWGALGIVRGAGWNLRLPAPLRARLSRLTAAAARRDGPRRDLLLGLVTPLLPCGWLYLFVLAAAGTGAPGWGAATLAVFWVGNLPALLLAGLGFAALLRRAGRAVPAASGALLVIVGALLLVQRSAVALPVAPAATAAQPVAPDPTLADHMPCCDAPR